MQGFVWFLWVAVGFLGGGLAFSESSPQQPEKLIFQTTPEAFDTLWDHLNGEILEAEIPGQPPGTKFAMKRFRTSGLTVICLFKIGDNAKRQCDFYTENHPNAYRDKRIGGVIEFRGAAAKAISENFKLKELWHLSDNPILPGQKIWRAGYVISKPDDLFLWEFYFDGKEYFAHFSRVWHPHHYVFDMFERKSTGLFDPKTDTFPKKEIVYLPSPGSSNSRIDDRFLEGMRGTLFGDRRARGMEKK
jgi:hypothetical protein